ncbi:pyridoxine biosynthesis protein [Exophiala xenobiotica]|uniref:Pyridoxine biosynthesis protein n=1 Tax=Vermiconidia calcicola TaxID=1690605 RepID=A0AAV9QLV2_9PEZI|nr:pyridoxine biosynthesis protein [Exophiala xenobiotica]KAK5544180.1 pyridoxine biosynthesis protein [Vermiconidia calcicola]KAK5547539.1 pyridoxine biosynthesis protein [Chaetothyriales sp. CCFEE 6169]KAK5229384.1 pyridoxine biosynthesis protein [Exophiala xenobiotica]KAK5271172.1 pyridoxine biosynthesis protein [Exophiala xenobiotica]
MAGRQSVRMLARQLTSSCSHSRPPTRRTFSSTSSYLAAHNFTMPAMSPTMTEGNISSWKVKEGDSFSSGDVLLEIETDKATMDVEAQDDGVMAKIFVQEGSKAVQVGTRIAVLADAGDDVSSLEIPADNSKPAESLADNVQEGKEDGNKYESSGIEKEIPGTPQNKRPAKDKPKTSPTGPGQNPKYPLYPSVIALIHENHMSDDDVLKISASGPNGRLLKGDVLAYLGTIESDYASKQSERIEHLAHLDLSNIKLGATPTKAAGTPPTTEAGSSVPELPKLSSISITVSLAEVLKVQKRIKDTLGVSVPLSTFLARAVDLANDDLPNPKGTKPSANDLFNAVLGLDTIPTTSRGTYLPQIDAFSLQSTRSSSSARRSTPIKKPDIIDILSGKAVPKRAAPLRPSSSSSLAASAGRSISTSTAEGALNTFSVTVPAGEEKRAKTFLERVKTVLQIEPGKLIL